MKNHLSLVSKLDGVDSFIVPLSTCQDRCNYFKIDVCYWKNNAHKDFKNPKRMYIRNLRLMRSSKFVKVLSNDILRANCRKFRFFSGGQTENLKQLIDVLKICKICYMVKFAIMLNDEIQIIQLIQSRYKIPKNANLLLSNYEENKPTPEFMINELKPHNIGYTQTTLNKKLATCEASTVKNGKCGTCEKCYNQKDITFMIHGKYNKKRILNNEM
jgi:hypothetical protein